MSAARKSSFNRSAAIAAIQISWKKISPGGDRDERLAWIADYLRIDELESVTDLTDAQLGSVAGEMKRLTGHTSQPRQTSTTRASSPGSNVVAGNFDRETDGGRGDHETIHLASPEQVFTLEKISDYMKLTVPEREGLFKRRRWPQSFRMLTFRQATEATNLLLHVAAHQDLKARSGGQPVSRKEINKYIPLLKKQLQIGEGR